MEKLKNCIKILMFFVPMASWAQLEVNTVGDILIGGAQPQYEEDDGLGSWDGYKPKIFVENKDGIFWQYNNRYLQVSGLLDEETYMSSSTDTIVLRNLQTGVYNKIWCSDLEMEYDWVVPTTGRILKKANSLVNLMNPVSYTLKESQLSSLSKSNVKDSVIPKNHYGFIAQEMEKILPSAVREIDNGMKVVNYNSVFPIIAAAFQDIQCQMAHQKSRMTEMKSAGKAIKSAVSLSVRQASSGVAINVAYTLPSSAQSAMLLVSTLDDCIKMRTSLATTANEYIVPCSGLSPGLYICSLIVDGKLASSVKLPVTK